MQNLQIYKTPTVTIRINKEIRNLLKVKAARLGKSMKALLEELLTEMLDPEQKVQKSSTATIDYFKERYKKNNSQMSLKDD